MKCWWNGGVWGTTRVDRVRVQHLIMLAYLAYSIMTPQTREDDMVAYHWLFGWKRPFRLGVCGGKQEKSQDSCSKPGLLHVIHLAK